MKFVNGSYEFERNTPVSNIDEIIHFFKRSVEDEPKSYFLLRTSLSRKKISSASVSGLNGDFLIRFLHIANLRGMVVLLE